MLAQLKQHGSDPLTPIVVQRGLRQDQIYYLEERAAQFPGVQTQDSYLRNYPYQSLAAQVLGYVGQISQQELQAAEEGGLPADATRSARRGSSPPTTRYLRGKNGTAQLTVDSRGRPQGRGHARGAAEPGGDPPADARHRPAARGREGAALRHQPRARGARGRARRRRRDRGDGPAERRGARDGLLPDVSTVRLRRPSRPAEARAGARPEDGGGAQLPGHQPRDRRGATRPARRSSR